MGSPMVGNERLEAVKVREKFGDALLKVKEYRGDTFLCVKRESIAGVSSCRPNMNRRKRDSSDSRLTNSRSMRASSGRIGRITATSPPGNSSVPSSPLGYGWIAMCR